MIQFSWDVPLHKLRGHNITSKKIVYFSEDRLQGHLFSVSKNLYIVTVNSEIFARNLFSRIVLKDIFATFKIRDLDMIYLH